MTYNKMGWDESTKTCDHTRMMKWVQSLNPAACAFVHQDCWQAYQAMPQGVKAGYYLDLCHYCGMRMRGNL